MHHCYSSLSCRRCSLKSCLLETGWTLFNLGAFHWHSQYSTHVQASLYIIGMVTCSDCPDFTFLQSCCWCIASFPKNDSFGKSWSASVLAVWMDGWMDAVRSNISPVAHSPVRYARNIRDSCITPRLKICSVSLSCGSHSVSPPRSRHLGRDSGQQDLQGAGCQPREWAADGGLWEAGQWCEHTPVIIL